MLIEGSVNTQKTQLLEKKYVDLLRQNVPFDNILVIVLNSYKKACFINDVKNYLSNQKYDADLKPAVDCGNELNKKQNIFTFFGLCYSAFIDNKKYISEIICSKKLNIEPAAEYGSETNIKDCFCIEPNLCGLEVSQFIFKNSIKEADFSDYISKINLLHQLFRRYSLIVQNSLTNEEIKKRSEILKESFAVDAQKAIENYKLKTIQYKSFDYLRQLSVLPLIYKNTNYFQKIKYLLVDDADEYSFAFWQFVYSIFPGLKESYIAYDKNGSSRCGYLCACKSAISKFKGIYNPKIIQLKDKSAFSPISETFFENIQNGKKTKFDNIVCKNFIKRLDMFEEVIKDINSLISKGVKPSEMAIITPLTDEVLINALYRGKNNFTFQILSGNEKLEHSPTVRHIIFILKIVNNYTLEEYEVKSLLINLLKIPCRKCYEVIQQYKATKSFQDCHINSLQYKSDIELNKNAQTNIKQDGILEYSYAFEKLKALISSLKKSKNKVSSKIEIIFSNIIKEFEVNIDIEKYKFLIKEAKSFELAFENDQNITDIEKEFINQIENSIISENPIDSFSLDKKSVIIASPQKIIDFSIKTKYQLWLDISSNEWLKQDSGTLYNAWVFNRDWEKQEYTFEDNVKLTREKTARVVRKLMLCAQNGINFYSSIYDNTGNENFAGLNDFIQIQEKKAAKYKIIPRPDQKPVLEYKKGKMGIMAVPGAGKTTILLALIIKLMNEGIASENIFVLTYMEAAAKNFKEKIKLNIPQAFELPNISTIHGLALRIIKENANFTKVGLDDNFEICDDISKEKIVREIFYKLKLDDEKYDNYLKCISIVKLSGNNYELYSKYKEIMDFFKFYDEYNKILKQNNLIDYDDMLYFAVKILEENPDILNYYQNICKYVIEDEAQDSSAIQQKLISLINGKYNNFVRCGDINQAITSTFTNSDLESFKNFIKSNKTVEMISSQRCAKPIYKFANDLIKQSVNNAETKNAFYQIQIHGTENNPKNSKTPEYIILEREEEEKIFISNKIKEILKNNPKASIAVLLRLNSQVNDYNEYFISEGIKTSVRSDCLSQKNIYKIIFNILEIIKTPVNNDLILSLAKNYTTNNIYKFKEYELNIIKNLKQPFINISTDEITTEGLLQLYWDIDYWLNNSSNDIDMSALKIGLYYSKNTSEKSNTYIISGILKRIAASNKDYEEILNKLKYTADKPYSAYKFFEDENESNMNSGISIMTMHKSKGDEFDYVFIPELNEENYPVSSKYVKLKSGGHFIQTIKNITEKSKIKTPEELKQDLTNEMLRLLYVGITRAKSELYLTNAKNYKKRKNTHNMEFIQKIFTQTN